MGRDSPSGYRIEARGQDQPLCLDGEVLTTGYPEGANPSSSCVTLIFSNDHTVLAPWILPDLDIPNMGFLIEKLCNIFGLSFANFERHETVLFQQRPFVLPFKSPSSARGSS